MRLLFLFPFLLALACEDPAPRGEEWTCGDGIPCLDEGVCEAGPCRISAELDGSQIPDVEHDGGLDGDVDSEAADAELIVPDMRICPPLEAPLLPRDSLGDLVRRQTVLAGGPVGPDAILVLNLDGDSDGHLEVVLARGGRVEVLDASGSDWWRTPVVDARRIMGAPDLDGDGRREVVVAAGADVLVLDGLTGQVRWQLPPLPLGPDRVLAAIHQVFITDFDDDELPDLYVTDVGCSGVGTGRGAVFGFGQRFGERLAIIDGPRSNGRCTRWHTALDVNGDRRRELILTDSRGLNVFDPLSGVQLACGDLEDTDARGILPNLPMGAGLSGWFVFLPDGVARLDWGPDDTDRCPGEHAVDSQWRHPQIAHPTGSFSSDTNDDGLPDLITSRWSVAEEVWQVVRFDGREGALTVLISDARLLGPFRFQDGGEQQMLVRVGDLQVPNRFGDLQVFDLGGRPSWAAPIAAAAPVYEPSNDVARTAEFTPLLLLPTADGHRLVITQGSDAEDTLVRRMAIVGPAGIGAVRALAGEPGFIGRVCASAPACHPETPRDRLVVTRGDGRIGILDADLLLRNPSPREPDIPRPLRPVGASRVVVATHAAHRYLAIFSAAGVLSVMDPNSNEAPLVWQHALGSPRRGTAGLAALDSGGRGGILVRDGRGGDAAWSVFEVEDGTLRWRHSLDPAAHIVMRPMVSGGDGQSEWVARMDRPATGRPLLPDPACPPDLVREPDLLAPDPDCPAVEILPRVITGIDTADGACRWRRVLRPAYPCSGPGNQALSVADGDNDGAMELYVTETNGLHRLDPDSGESTGFRRLGRGNTGALRGGGWIRSTSRPPMVIRAGGNAPIEALDLDLNTLWTVSNPADLRLQSWIGRDVITTEEGIWLVPGRGWPLHRYALDDGGVQRRIGFIDGVAVPDAEAASMYADIVALTGVTDIDGQGGDGLLVSTDDGFLFALDADGAVIWVRAHDAAIGGPLVEQLDGAGLREMVVPTGDGRILVYGEPGPAPPALVWDLPCPATATCDEALDIDESTDTTRFCGEWTPYADVEGYEARVIGPNGAVIRDWTAFAESSATFNGLRLVPGIRYALEVRVFNQTAGQPLHSTGTTSDGVLIIDNGAPRVLVEVDPDPLVLGSGPAMVTVRASDDDRLAGWHLDVIDADSDGLAVRLASAALNQPFFEDIFPWDTTDRDKRPLAAGVYRIRAEFTDRAGNTGAGETLLTICDGPCP